MTPDEDNLELNNNSNMDNSPVVPASYGGYFMQTFFAFYELCRCGGNGSIVSIEFVDDIGVQRGDENTLIQLKTSFSGNPTSDLSSELWKTIYNWCQLSATDGKKLEYAVISFHDLREGELLTVMSNAKDSASAEIVYEKIKEKLSSSKNSEPVFLSHRQYLMNISNKSTVANVVANMHVTVFNNNFLSELDAAFKHVCLSSKHAGDFKTHMLGWVDSKIADLLSQGKEIKIDYGEFEKELLRQIEIRGANPLQVDVTEPSDEEIMVKTSSNPVYLIQLDLIKATLNQKRSAVRNYSISAVQFDRWIADQDISRDEYKIFKKNLCDSYENVKQSMRGEFITDPADKGMKLYTELDKTVANNAKVGTYSLDPRCVRGAIQELSDEKIIGWHEDYLELIERGVNKDE